MMVALVKNSRSDSNSRSTPAKAPFDPCRSDSFMPTSRSNTALPKLVIDILPRDIDEIAAQQAQHEIEHQHDS